MKIVVIGPGALGCLLAASITARSTNRTTAEQHPLWLLDRDPQRAADLTKNGLVLEENQRRLTCPIQATADPTVIGKADLILLCVKARDVKTGLRRAAQISGPGSLLIALQNGIGHLQLLDNADLAADSALGVTAQGANLLGPGHVRHAGQGVTRLGFAHEASPAAQAGLKKVAGLLCSAGIKTVVSQRIIDHIWTKLLINVGINALTVIFDCPNGGLLDEPKARRLMRDAVLEAAAVARAQGIRVADDPVAKTLQVCRATGRNISSMLQDIRRKKPTEIDAINGAVAAAGRRLNLPVGTNERLIRRIKEIENNY